MDVLDNDTFDPHIAEGVREGGGVEHAAGGAEVIHKHRVVVVKYSNGSMDRSGVDGGEDHYAARGCTF